MEKILIVEDDQVLVNMYQKLLTNHGYDVHIAMDGEDGLEKALSIHPDLILLDILMPKFDGMALMHKLRADDWGKDASIIIFSNMDVNDERLAGVIADQPSYYLVKANTPPEMMLGKIKEILHNKKEVQ